MNYLSVERLAKNYGEKVLFQDISFGLDKGDKTALIANNGTGKSTLLRILAGKDTPDDGNVAFRKGIRIGFLEQEPQLNGELTIGEFVGEGHSGTSAIIRKYHEALHNYTRDHSSENQKTLEKATRDMDVSEAWDFDRRMTEVLDRFGLNLPEQKISTLSGGQRKRLALAFILIDQPDLLILDEPTNHLDVDMIEWLEQFLMTSTMTLLMVTHDRYFLDRVCDHILELEGGKLYHHVGDYEFFLEKRAEREDVANTEAGKAKQLMRKELDWIRRQPKARGTKSKSRIDAFYQLKERAGNVKIKDDLKLDVKMSRIGGKILELKKVYKSYGDNVLMKGFDYTFKKGERIGVIGKNGVGKSTFLRVITGEEPADSGKVNIGETIVFGHYSQEGIRVKEDKRVIEVLKEAAEVIQLSDGSKVLAAQLLEQFNFTPDMQYSLVSNLSGGERRRLALLMVLIKNPNFLILDEPTNDLDLLTLNRLEEFLMNFPGCLILVSHDRYFMDKLVDHFFTFEGNGIIHDHIGTYTEYRLKKEAELAAEKKKDEPQDKESAKKIKSEPADKKKLSFNERKEYESLEREIETLENEKTELEELINSGISDYEKLLEKTTRLQQVNEEIDEKSFRWMELDELA